MVTAWLICAAGWAVVTLWPTSFVASTVIHADLAKLIEQNVEADSSEQTPISILRSLLLSEDAVDDVRSQTSLDQAKAGSLQDDLVLRSTVQPVFILTYEHRDPDVAKQVLETVIASFRNRLNETSAAFEDGAEALDKLIDDHELRIQFAEADLVAFKRTNADYLDAPDSEPSELPPLEEEVTSLEQQLEATIAKRDGIAEELAKARNPEVDNVDAAASKSPEQLETERKTLNSELAKLRERYADSHPYVVAVLDAIETLDTETEAATKAQDAAIADEEATIDRQALAKQHGELIIEVSTLNSRLTEKRSEIELLQALTQTATSVEAELAELETGKKTLTDALSDLQQRRDELGEVKGGEAKQEAFRLIRQPETPTDPTGPSRMVALLAVLVGGAGIGAVAAILCNRLKGVFENAWQLRRRFDVGVLGTISEVMTPLERKQLGYSRLAFGLAGLALIGVFSSLAFAELTNNLAPLGDHLRSQLLG